MTTQQAEKSPSTIALPEPSVINTPVTETPFVSVIVINWNTFALTAKCLETVAEEAERLPSGAVETIVIDNASTDGSTTLLQQRFPWINLYENRENIGFAAANNQALAYCRGDYILLLNSDTEVKPGAVGELLAFIENHPNVGIVGSRYLNPDGSLQPSCYPAPTLVRELWRMFHLDKLYPFGVYSMQRWPTDQPRAVDIVQGASLLIRCAITQELGLFDTDYFMYTEEVDLCQRVRQAGWQIYWVPTSCIVHYGGQSTQQIAEAMFLQLYRSKILYFRKHYGRTTTVLYKWVLLLATVTRLLLTPLAWLQQPARRNQSLTLANHYRQLAVALRGM